MVRTMFWNVMNIKEFRSLLLASLSLQEFLIVAKVLCEKILWLATDWRITFVESAL